MPDFAATLMRRVWVTLRGGSPLKAIRKKLSEAQAGN